MVEVIQPMVLKGITKDVGPNIGGYYAGLPGDYYLSLKSYPLLLYMHGGGQFGNGAADLPNLLSEGIPALLDTKKFPSAIKAGGQSYSFLVMAPQFRSYPSNADVQAFLDFVKTNYRIDAARIYVTGFSQGGRITCDYAAYQPTIISAIVSMAGASNSYVAEKCKNIVDAKLAVWAFHNKEDELIPAQETENFISMMNGFNPSVLPRLTIFPNSSAPLKHDAWTKATDPDYKENGLNIYEWMLQFKR